MAAFVSLAGWTFIPNLASGFVHNSLSRLLPGLAPPGTQKYGRDRRIIYVVVVASYLLYTIYAAYAALPPNFYEMLGVPLDVEEKALRTSFRRLSARYHPDKGGDEEIFRSLRIAYDTISNPIVRFGYDRFGPAAIAWQEEKTYLDMMYLGFQTSLPFYVASVVFTFIFGWFRSTRYGSVPRFLTLITLACIHNIIVTRRDILPIFAFVLPRKIQFEQVSLLQTIAMTITIAISQVGPALFPPEPDLTSDAVLTEFATLANLVKLEATQSLEMTHYPFPRGTTKAKDLYDATVDWLVQAKIDQDPEVVAARQEALQARHS